MAIKHDGPEIWVDIPNSKQYQINNFGDVRRKLKNGKVKSIVTYCVKNKWIAVKVEIGGIYKRRFVHHLMARAFHLYQTSPTQLLHHKNGLIRDNRVENLEWIDKGKLGKKTGSMSASKAVRQIDPKTGETINYYKSAAAAARDVYIHKETIYMALRGQLKTAAEFKWERDEEGDDK